MKRGLASPWVHSALPMTRRMRLQLSRVDQRKSLKRRAGLPVRSLLPPARRPSRSRSRRQPARCAPGRRRSPPGWPRTTPSAPRGRSRCRRAAGCAPAASARGSGRRCARPPPPRRPRHRCSSAAASPPAGAGRRRYTAADSSNSHNSRGRTGLPAGRAADHRWHRDRA